MNMKSSWNHSLVSAALIAVSLVLSTGGADAADDNGLKEDASKQTNSGSVWDDVDEFIVSGTASAITLNSAPIAVTAFDAIEIQEQGFNDLRDISSYTPNLEIKSAFAASNPTLFVRGVGLNDLNANSSSAVAVYVDDIYMASPAGQLGQVFDLENIEVLSGPQGTRYGRNASAGAIRVLSRKPSGIFDVRLSSSYGRFNSLKFEAAVEIPVLEERIGLRVAGVFNQRDGITKNRCGEDPTSRGCVPFEVTLPPGFSVPTGLPKRVNDVDNWAARALISVTPDAPIEFLLNVHGGANRGGALQFQHTGTKPTFGDTDQLLYRDKDGGDPFAGAYNLVGQERLDLLGGWLRAESVLGDISVTFISGYEWNDRTVEENSDANPINLIESLLKNTSWQVTEDLEISGIYRALEWSVGGWMLHERLEVDNVFDPSNPILFEQTFEQDTLAAAVFVRGTLALGDFTIDGGARLNWEEKEIEITSFRVAPSTGRQFGELSDREKDTWIAPTWELSLAYELAADITTYIKVSKGFKSGHFNGGAVTANTLITPVKPEVVNGYEWGLKSYWFDRALTFNLAAFLQEYKNLQIFQLSNSADSLPLAQLINANDARIYGLEMSVVARPTEGLDMRMNFGWLETEYLDLQSTFFEVDVNPPNRPQRVQRVVDFSGNRLVGSPRFSLSGSIKYRLDIGRFGSLSPRYDFAFRDDVFFDASEGRGIRQQLPSSALGQDGYWIHNLRLTYATPNEQIEVAGWVRNLADQQYKTNAFDQSVGNELVLSVFGDPRTYGLTVTVKFQ